VNMILNDIPREYIYFIFKKMKSNPFVYSSMHIFKNLNTSFMATCIRL